MGEATYYFKARFKSQADAEAALPRVKRLISEGIEAQDYWQDHRGMEREGKRAEFWKEFKKKFPVITKYLESYRVGCCGHEHFLVDGDCNNDLAGQLDFGSHQDDADNAEVHGSEIHYNATVWHFSHWDGFMQFLKSEFGAVKTGWLSDEYVDPSELVELS